MNRSSFHQQSIDFSIICKRVALATSTFVSLLYSVMAFRCSKHTIALLKFYDLNVY